MAIVFQIAIQTDGHAIGIIATDDEFISAEVTDMEMLSDSASATYTYYQQNIKPKPQEAPKAPEGQHVWRCKICGYEYVGETLPDDYICPICKHPASDFEQIS